MTYVYTNVNIIKSKGQRKEGKKVKFLVIRKQKRSMDEYVDEFETLEEAVEFADDEYNYYCDNDRKNCEYFYILESVNPDKESENHYDGNYAKIYKQ